MHSHVTAGLVVALLGVSVAAQQERPPVDKSSVELTVKGCLKGRVLSSIDVQASGTEPGTTIKNRAFRLAGKKDVMEEVKAQNGKLVEIVGLVKRSAFAEAPAGMPIGSGRIAFGGGPMSTDPTRNPARDPMAYIVTMDASAVRFMSDECPLR